MPRSNWKSLLLVGGVAAVGSVLLMAAIVWTIRLPLLGWSGLLAFVLLIVLTLLCSRLTVPVTNVDGTSQTHKSVADALIFLAVMIYALPPTETMGPAIILAAIVGFLSSFSLVERWSTVFPIAMTIISTFVASLVYRLMILTFAGGALTGSEHGLVLDLLLFPLCVFGIVQYALSTFGTSIHSAQAKAALLCHTKVLFGLS